MKVLDASRTDAKMQLQGYQVVNASGAATTVVNPGSGVNGCNHLGGGLEMYSVYCYKLGLRNKTW